MSRPSTPLISRERAVALSIKMIDRDGLDEFSLPRLAREMNVRTPSLYHHFQSRTDLAEDVASSIIAETKFPSLPEDAGDWQDWFVALAVNFRAVVFRHRNAALLLLEHLPREPFLPFYEICATLLGHAGVPAEVHLQVIEGLETVVFGATLAEAARPESAGFSFPYADPETYPSLAAAMAANPLSSEELLEAKVRSFLLGVLDLHAGAAGTRRAAKPRSRRVASVRG